MNFTYTEGGELISDIQDVPDCVANSTDDSINHMYHTVCGHLVAEDDPSTVHCHNLQREEMLCYYKLI